MTALTFVETPPSSGSSRRAGPVARFAAALAESPGRWAVYPGPGHSGTAVKMRRDYGLEAMTRTVDGQSRIYARAVAESPATGLPEAVAALAADAGWYLSPAGWTSCCSPPHCARHRQLAVNS